MSLLFLPQDETLVEGSPAVCSPPTEIFPRKVHRDLPYDTEDLGKEPRNRAAMDIRSRLNREKGGLPFYTINKQGELATQFLTRNFIKRALTLESLGKDDWAVPDGKLVSFCLGEAFSIFLMLLIHIGAQRGGVLRMAMEKLLAKGLTDKNIFPIPPLSDTVIPEGSVVASATTGMTPGSGRINNGSSRSQFDEEEERILLGHQLGSVDPEIFERGLISDLYESQWKYPGRLPIFSSGRDGTNLSIHESSMLPFTKRGGDEEIQRGAFGEVSRVWIHEAHIRDDAGVILPQEQSVREKVEKGLNSSKQSSDWAKELGNMREVSNLKLDHCVRFFTGFRKYREGHGGRKEHTQFYLLFEWANGGTLAQLWTMHHPTPKLSGNIIKQSIVQLLGMAKALARIHEQLNNKTGVESNMRHGDLKPGNILRFTKEPEDPADPIGTLKIGDWGLAKHHTLATQLRIAETSTKYATLRYEPPEADHQPKKPTSRTYDIWSMGCIILEYIIWLMYGKAGLEAFHNNLQTNANNNRPETTPFYRPEGSNGVVDEIPRGWMAHLETDPCCQPGTPLGALLDIVRTKLLVVALPAERSSTMTFKQSGIPVRSRGSSDLRPGASRRDSGGLGHTIPRHPTPQVPGIVVSKSGDPSHSPDKLRQTPEPKSDGPTRGLAKDLEDGLEGILREGDNDPTHYWARGIDAGGQARKPPNNIRRRRAQETLTVPTTQGPSADTAPPHPGKNGKTPAAELRIAGNPNQTVVS
ncbi:hypothetical protein RB595_005222 [Gaeumannomyces hyphopodioides]